MPQLDLSPAAQHWLCVVLIWVGFGALAGLLAGVILPMRHPAGPFATLVVGIVGSALGPLALCSLIQTPLANPISPLGFLAATAGAFLLLILYHLCRAYVDRGKANAQTRGENEELGIRD